MSNFVGKKWRDSASLIVLAKKATSLRQNHAVDYETLVQRRGADAPAFANSVVFPGGVTEEADAAPAWIRLIKSFGYSQAHFDALHAPSPRLPPILQDNPVHRHVSLRITAIRETFEELGILFCSQKEESKRSGPAASVISDFDIKYWQQKVRNKPEDLLTLCEELRCYPDIWALHFWSNWLTPANLEHRFDTAFFVTAVEDKPVRIEPSSEVETTEWVDPTALLARADTTLFPPQVYELTRLTRLGALPAVLRCAARLSRGPHLPYCSVPVTARDGLLLLLPGDDMYPADLTDYSVSLDRSLQSVDELRAAAGALHRLERCRRRRRFVVRNLRTHHVPMPDMTIELRDY